MKFKYRIMLLVFGGFVLARGWTRFTDYGVFPYLTKGAAGLSDRGCYRRSLAYDPGISAQSRQIGWARSWFSCLVFSASFLICDKS
jgi:hypothetical protein